MENAQFAQYWHYQSGEKTSNFKPTQIQQLEGIGIGTLSPPRKGSYPDRMLRLVEMTLQNGEDFDDKVSCWLQDQLDFRVRVLNGKESVPRNDWVRRQRLEKLDELVDDFPQILDIFCQA